MKKIISPKKIFFDLFSLYYFSVPTIQYFQFLKSFIPLKTYKNTLKSCSLSAPNFFSCTYWLAAKTSPEYVPRRICSLIRGFNAFFSIKLFLFVFLQNSSQCWRTWEVEENSFVMYATLLLIASKTWICIKEIRVTININPCQPFNSQSYLRLRPST